MMMVVLILFAVSFGVDFHLLDLGVAAAWFGFLRLLRVLRLIVTYSFNLSVTFVIILHGTKPSRYERIFGYNNTTTTTTTEKIRRSIRTWPTFLSPSSFSILLPLPRLYDRFNNNLYAFRGNYVIVSLFIFFIHLPITTIIFLIIIGTIINFYFEKRDRVVLISLSLIMIGVVVVSGVWRNAVLSVFRAGFLVSLHATLRISDAHCDTPFATLSRKMQRIWGGYTGWFYFLLD
ncbi:PRA1 family protein D-like protein [Tanacetum coccineum]